MPKLNDELTAAKGWATAHVIAAVLIALAAGALLGAALL
jgi:hypothetical protein